MVSNQRLLRLCVLAAASFFVAGNLLAQTNEANGTVRIEAEFPSQNIARTISDPASGVTNTYAWTNSAAIGGFTGSGLMQVLPNDAMTVATNWISTSPELRYTVNFTNAGTYYVWLRGYAESTESQSVYVGLNGVSPAAAQIDLPKTGAWSWSNKAAGATVPVAITVPSAGQHTINVWMRDAGFALDKILLTLNAAYTPEYSADFWRNQSIYQIITDRFYDGVSTNNNYYGGASPTTGNKTHGGDWKGVENKLDYIKSLGASAIWISPVLRNSNGDFDYHGYAATDFYNVDLRFGSLQDLQRLVAESHRRGILVIADVVVNHGSTWVDSADAGWAAFLYPPAGYNLKYNSGGRQYAPPFDNASISSVFGNNNLANIFHNNGGTQNWGDSTQVELGELVSLDDFRTESAYVRTKMKEIWTYWINTVGFDAYRIDTVKHVEMGFWNEWTPVIRAAAAAADKPNFFIFGEIFDGSDSKCGSYTGTKSGGNFKMDSVLDYPLYYQVNSVFATATGNTAQIEGRYGNLTAANYDATATNSLVLNLDNHDNPRFLSTAIGGNTTRLEVALAFLYTSRGIPSLYYGTEQDFDGGADPWNREDMFDGQFEGGPSNGDNFNMTSPRFKLVAKLNNFRRLYPSLRTGTHNNLWANGTGPGLFAYARRLGNEEVYVVLNTSSATQTIGTRPTIHPAGTVLVNLLNSSETYTVTTGVDGIPSITMPANSYKMFVAQSQVKALNPVVNAVTPAHDASGISTGSAITVTFDRAMNPTTTQAAFSTVPATTGTYAWSAGNTVLTYTPSPLAGNTLYTVRIASSATDSNGLSMFAPFESRFATGAASTLAKPSINSVSFSGVTTSAATLGATVTPNGATTTVIFEYGTTTAYGTSTASQSIGSGNSPVTVNATLSGLLPGTTYHFRAVAQNSQGTTNGPDATFTTDVVLPQVTTTAASFVTTASASLNGDVNPNGISTTYYFEYGVKSDTLDQTTPVQDAGSAAGLVARWASISGLSPETTYYFRVVAQSGANTVRGSVLSFTTLPVKPTVGLPSVQNVTPTGATVTSAVNPNGTDSTVWVEYGTDTSYGSATIAQSVPGASASPVTITAELAGLLFGQTYHYRFVAQNTFGTTYGSDQTFTTGYPPPTVTTGPVTATTTNSATLSGTVNPNGPETIYWFEYGTTPAYGLSTRSGASDDFEFYTTTTLNYSTTSANATVTANGGSGFGQFTSYVRSSSASTVNPTRGGIRCVTTNSINGSGGRQIDGLDSLGVFAGSSTASGTHSGYRPVTTPRQFGQVNFSARFDISNAKGFTGINLKSANGTTFGANELLSVGISPAGAGVGGNTALLVTDASGQRNLDLGAEVRGAVTDVRIDFDTKAGTYTCGAKFRADAVYKTISGTLKLSGASVSMTTLGYINGNNTGELAQHMILDNLQVVSAASAGSGTSPVAVSGSLAGLAPNTTYYYRTVAQNSIGQAAGAGSSFFTGANATPTISNIADQTVNRDTSTGAIPFTVGDIETAAASLLVTGSSSNKTLVPDANVVLGGSGANRTVTVTPAAGQTGASTITVTVSDGALTATDTFVLTVNAPPTISTIVDQSIDEDTVTAAIPFTVGDTDTAVSSLAVTAVSSNQSLVPDASIVLGGSGANRTVTVTPAANANGTATITITVNDGRATATGAFLLTVNPTNDVPAIGSIANQTVTVGAATPAIPFTVADNETAAGSLSLTASSSNQTLVPDGNIALGGSGANRTITVTPAAGQAGMATITITVNDGSLTTSTSFVLTANAPPTISPIAAQTIDEDNSTGAIAITVGDAETPVSSLLLAAVSSNQSLVPDGNIVFGGTGANRTVTITPAANANGTATITVSVSDGQASSSSVFLLTVNPVNDPPTISAIGDQGIPMNTPTPAIAFTVGDVETAVGSLTLSGTSSNTTLVPDANIVFGGSGANRNVTVTPAAGQFGAATITVTVSDGSATAQQTFVLTVTQNSQPPTISDMTDRTIFVGSNTGPISFTIGDADTDVSLLTLSKASSNTTLVPTANIVFGGSGASRTVTVTPAAGQSGTATITVTVSDGTLTASDTFVLTVNQPPDITVEQSRGWDSATNNVYSNSFVGLNGGYGYSNWTTTRTGTLAGSYIETNGVRTFAIYAGGGTGNGFTASRPFTTAMTGGEVLRVQLGHTTVSTGGEIGMRMYSGTNTNALFAIRLASGTTAQWQFNDGGTFFNSGLTNTTNATGTPLSVMFKRNAGPGYDIQLTRGTNVVGGTNWGTNRPVMAIDRVEFYSTAQGANQNFRFANLERVMPAVAGGTPAFDFGTVRVAAPGTTLNYIVRNDGAGPLSGLALSKSGSNSNDFAIGSLAATNLAARTSTTLQIKFNPTGQATRSAAVNIVSTDPDENPFVLNLTGNGLNDAPAISNIPDQPLSPGMGTGPISFQIGDLETPANSLVITATSSDQTFVPNGNIVLGGSGADRTIAVTPVANQNGSAVITVTISDGDRSVSDTFTVSVASVNNTPTISSIADQTISTNTPTPAPNSNIVLGGADASRTVTVTPADGLTGIAYVTLTVSDGAKTANSVFKVTIQGTGGYAQWSTLSTLPAELRAPADRNGPMAIPNLAAYAMGLDPLTASPTELPGITKNSNNLSISFRRSRTATDITFDVEAANTMTSTWTNIWSSVTNAYTGGSNDFETVVVTDPQPVDQAPSGQRYLRLKVSSP